MNKKQYVIVSALAGIILLTVALFRYEERPLQKTYFHNEGKVFGTYYKAQYDGTADLQPAIDSAFKAFDRSLSMFNPESVISAVNNNRDTVTDAQFEQMWAQAMEVSEWSEGAFDITVAPLVNLWGFGFKHREEVTEAKIDSVMPLIGWQKVRLENHHVIKEDPRMMLDASAVAKGQACDVIAEVLKAHGAENWLVDIGGEVVSRGNNSQGNAWRIGITKPVDDSTGVQNEIQEVIEVHDIAMATSGNYRNFYYEGKERRSHTIDPRSGKPVQHSLLSATVVAGNCMKADALATACMVLGEEKALPMIEKAGAACYLIIAQGDSLVVKTSKNWQY